MRAFIAIVLLSIAAAAAGIYNKQQLIIWFGMNDHEQVAHQFWFDNKIALDEKGTSDLPFNANVKTFTYTVGEAIEQDGVYYFQSMLYINGMYRMPIFTAVKATNGMWNVDQDATFASIGDASIKYYTQLFADSSSIPSQFLTYNLGALSSQQDREKFVDQQIIEIRKAMLAMVQ